MMEEKMKPVYEAIEQTFINRMKNANYDLKKGSKAYNKARVEFFSGVMGTLHAVLSQPLFGLSENEINGLSMPAMWALPIMSGRDLKCEEDAK